MGKSEDLKKGQWVIAIGHPGGFKKGRSAPVRLGRVLENSERVVRTDCTLVGGDSGGPLFDMEGKVVGIHSRIGDKLSNNYHIPVDTYRTGWDRMVKAEVWGVAANGPYLGVQTDPDAKDCKITSVVKDSPAEKAGFKENDVIVKFDDTKVSKADDLFEAIRKKKAGDEVSVEVRRGDETVTLKIKLGKRGG
jgi:serine protease Do